VFTNKPKEKMGQRCNAVFWMCLVASLSIVITLGTVQLGAARVEDPTEQHTQSFVQFGLQQLTRACKTSMSCLDNCRPSILAFVCACLLISITCFDAFASLCIREPARKWRQTINRCCRCPTIRRRYACSACWNVVSCANILFCLWLFEEVCVDAMMDVEQLSTPHFHIELYIAYAVTSVSALLTLVYLVTGRHYSRRNPVFGHNAADYANSNIEDEDARDTSSEDGDDHLADTANDRHLYTEDHLDVIEVCTTRPRATGRR